MSDSDPWELEHDLRDCQKHLQKSLHEGAPPSVIWKIEQNCYEIDKLLSRYDDRRFEK
jgi:hypothetical protein